MFGIKQKDNSIGSNTIFFIFGILVLGTGLLGLSYGKMLLPTRYNGIATIEGTGAIIVSISFIVFSLIFFINSVRWNNSKLKKLIGNLAVILFFILNPLGFFYSDMF